MGMRVLRVCLAGRDPEHRRRDRALVAAGVSVTLVVPSEWPGPEAEAQLSGERFPVIELPVRRAGSVNGHAYVSSAGLQRVINETRPQLLDFHGEPFGLAARQWLRAAPAHLPVVMYAAQNVDKRFPPPFSLYERAAYRRVDAFYPCTRQAASVIRGKGFTGRIEVLPLGYDPAVMGPGQQSLAAEEIVLAITGRLVPEKGVQDAVRVLRHVNSKRAARLIVVGEGPEAAPARRLADALGVGDRVEFVGWRPGVELADICRSAHVVLVPSRPSETWVEQFGRVIVEAQASGAVVAGYASGAIPEVAGEAGLLVPVGDFRLLAAEVVRLLLDPAEFDRRRKSGRRKAETRTWDAVATRQAAVYDAVLAEARAPRTLPRSKLAQRAAARAEFGQTARTLSGARPFALPVLRRGGCVARALATLIDATAEVTHHVRMGLRGMAARRSEPDRFRPRI